MKNMLKYGVIFTIIYSVVLLVLTLYAGRLMPAELDIIVPLWLLVKSQIVEMTVGFSSPLFLSIIVVMQAIVAFIQGAIIGAIVNVFVKK